MLTCVGSTTVKMSKRSVDDILKDSLPAQSKIHYEKAWELFVEYSEFETKPTEKRLNTVFTSLII